MSIQALIDRNYDGSRLSLGAERGSTSAYRQYYATFRGDGLTISGRINIPRGTGPFPAVVLAHGYVDPSEYTNGQTMLRERDYLARKGYITLHVDYRNHAASSRDPEADPTLRLGYTVDTINAGLALQQDSRVDPDRIALVGRSMGGGVVYNALVVRPGLFKAAVAYAPVSSDAVDNFNTWVRGDSTRPGVADQVIARLGTPEPADRGRLEGGGKAGELRRLPRPATHDDLAVVALDPAVRSLHRRAPRLRPAPQPDRGQVPSPLQQTGAATQSRIPPSRPGHVSDA